MGYLNSISSQNFLAFPVTAETYHLSSTLFALIDDRNFTASLKEYFDVSPKEAI